MRVLQVTPAFFPAHVYGGPIQSIYLLSCHLGRMKCDVRVLTTDANGSKSVLDVDTRREIEIEPHVYVRYCRRKFRHAVSHDLLELLPQYVKWADVVHLRGVYSFPTIPTLLVCKMLQKPVVWTPHGAFQQWQGVKRKRAKAAWEQLCKLVAPRKLVIHTASDQEAQTAFDRFPTAQVANIPHGILIPREMPHKDDDGFLRLLYIGRLHPIKGIEQLLDACKILKCTSEMSWTLTIAGVGAPDYTRTLENRINDLGLWQEVKLLGEVVGQAKEDLFATVDLVVVPSLTESFSLVVAESLSHGIPVVASTGTPWSRIEEVGCGLWVRNDPETLAAAIKRMRNLPLLKMGSIGREWMEKEFTWERRTQEMIHCYERLIG